MVILLELPGPKQVNMRCAGILLRIALLGAIGAPLYAQSGAPGGEWPTYGGDLGNTRYSALDQINAANFNRLQIAWRFKTEKLGPEPEYRFEATPLDGEGRAVHNCRLAADGGGA